MTTPTSAPVLRSALVRALAVAVVTGVLGTAAARIAPPADADIGWGLVVFALLAAASFVGGWWDASRRPFGEIAVTWAVASVLLAVLTVAVVEVRSGGPVDPQTLLLDVVLLVPVLVVVTLGSALAGAGVGHLVNRRAPRLS